MVTTLTEINIGASAKSNPLPSAKGRWQVSYISGLGGFQHTACDSQDEAMQCAAEILSTHGSIAKRSKGLQNKILACYEQGDYEQAIEMWEKSDKRHPKASLGVYQP